jgi:glycosyltransferase involved in cell wall biosynthesis
MTMRASVVVPTYRRPDLLDRCLAALVAQDFDATEFEILIADDPASESTARQVEAWRARTSVKLRYLPVVGAHGPAAARNVGWQRATAPIIAFTDDDCIPDPRWLARGVAAFRDETAAVTGRVVVPRPEMPTDYERDAAGLERGEFVTANCFVRRDVLEAVGGFDERFACAWREDSDLHFVILRREGRIDRAEDAVVVHPVRPAPWGISLKQQRKSLFNALLYKKHASLNRRRIRAWPPWDYYAIVASPIVLAASALRGDRRLVLIAAAFWMILTVRFCARRLRDTSRRPAHVAEMIVTSALIPPLSVFWRLYGAFKFHVLFL